MFSFFTTCSGITNHPLQNCQEYLRTLCSSVSQSALSSIRTPTNIVVIGCGSPELIPFYASTSSCHFPIYADPTRKLYQSLGMISTKSPGPRPNYQQRSLLSISLESIYQGLSRGKQALKGGDFWQVGGEFLLEDGDTVWSHRMSSTRDHTEVPELRRVLGLEGEGARREIRRGLSFRGKSWRSASRGTGIDRKGRQSAVVEEKEALVDSDGSSSG